MNESYTKAFVVMSASFLTAAAFSIVLLGLGAGNAVVVLTSIFSMVLFYGLLAERIEYHLYEARDGKYYKELDKDGPEKVRD